jgi:hypothetical protein
MAEVFNKIRPGYKLVTAKLEWKFEMPFLYTTDTKTTKGFTIRSRFFSSPDLQETGDQWQYEVNGMPILEPVKVKIAILDWAGSELFKEAMVTTQPYERNDKYSIEFKFEKK